MRNLSKAVAAAVRTGCKLLHAGMVARLGWMNLSPIQKPIAVAVGTTYRSPDGNLCKVVEYTVDPQDCVALVRYRLTDSTIEEIISLDEFRENFPFVVSRHVGSLRNWFDGLRKKHTLHVAQP